MGAAQLTGKQGPEQVWEFSGAPTILCETYTHAGHVYPQNGSSLFMFLPFVGCLLQKCCRATGGTTNQPASRNTGETSH